MTGQREISETISTPTIDEYRQRGAQTIAASQEAPRIVDAVAAREAGDRSMITRWVMIGFFISLVAIFLLLVAKALIPGRWDEPVTQAIEIFKTGLLPVVTLVLGFYFGRSDRR